MATANISAAVTAILERYRIKYPNRAARISALKADYLAAFDAATLGKELTSIGVDGQTSAWAVSLSPEERLSAMAEAIQRLERRAVSAGTLYAR